jgi:DNA-3-methyladenine glycosylase II
LDFDGLDGEDDATVVANLTRVKGIGRWTAEMYLMFSLGRLDVFPLDDGSIRTAMRRIYGIPEAGFLARAEKVAEGWRPFRTIASWYLYRYLDLPAEGD